MPCINKYLKVTHFAVFHSGGECRTSICRRKGGDGSRIQNTTYDSLVVSDLTRGGTVVFWSSKVKRCMEQRTQRGDCWQSKVFLCHEKTSQIRSTADMHCSLFLLPVRLKTTSQQQDLWSGCILVQNQSL